MKYRNPKGKFKQTPSAKGIVTLFITVGGILSLYSDYPQMNKSDVDMKKSLVSRLDNNVPYSNTILARKGKHNVILTYTTNEDGITRETLMLNNNLDDLITFIKYKVIKFKESENLNYRERLISTDYIKVIFKPLVNTNSKDDIDNNHGGVSPPPLQEVKTSEKG